MAWRDSRGSRRRLLLYVSSIVAGVAALVAIGSFQANLNAAIEDRAKTLLGADLRIDSQRAFSAEAEELLRSLSPLQSRQVEFASMAYFPGPDTSRLVSVRALEGGFPYYGELETDPIEAAAAFRNGREALVDDGLMLQFELQVGDEVRLGQTTFRIAGRLLNVAGEIPTRALISPRVYIPMAELVATELIQLGSRAGYTAYIAFDDPLLDPDVLVEELRPRLRDLRLRADTVQRRKKNVGTALSNLNAFLTLVGFSALLLGSVGVASSIHLYVSGKLETVAVLRCLGAKPSSAVSIFVIQIMVLGLVGAGFGAATGVAVQMALPLVLAGFLPTDIPFFIAPLAILEGVAVGTSVALLFGSFPLLAVRDVSPLLALRALGEEKAAARKDPRRWFLAALIVAAGAAYLMLTSPSPRTGAILFGGMLGVFALLFIVAQLIMRLARALPTAGLRYETRQGLANLYRPRNQTSLLMLSLGLGTFLILTLILIQASLVAGVGEVLDENELDLIVWDIQADQIDGVRAAFDTENLPVERTFPVVPMRISHVEGTSVTAEDRRSWATRWDYSATYRRELRGSERVVAGEWIGRVDPDIDPVPISIDRQVAEDLGVEVGGELVFDVQGISLNTVVASIRGVEWEQEPPNFLVVFPEGALEAAPQFHVIVSSTSTPTESAAIQRRLVREFPNVAIIDLNFVMQTVEEVLDEISFVIRFMALFTVATGIVVLVAAVVTSRLQRVREGVLLRTLGASRAQINRILRAEYLFLGAFAALTGLSLSIVAAWLLARYLFDVTFVAPLGALVGAATLVVLATLMVGMISSRGICNRPPLEVLRSDVG